MKQQKTILLFITTVLMCGCAGIHIPDPHTHVVDVHATPWQTDLAPDAVILKVSIGDKIAKNNIITNQGRTMLAFSIPVKQGAPDWQVEYVYFQTIGTDDLWVILGIPMEHRPFSDLIWIDDRYLIFDRWSNPHYGMHYVVDTALKKLILATPFPDRFFIDQQRESSQQIHRILHPRRVRNGDLDRSLYKNDKGDSIR